MYIGAMQVCINCRKVFCLLLLVLCAEGFCSCYAGKCICRFAPSTGYGTVPSGKHELYFGEPIGMSKPGYYIVLGNYMYDDKVRGTFFAYLPLSGNEAEVSFMQALVSGYYMDQWKADTLQAREKSIEKMHPQLQKACKKKTEFPEELVALMKTFFERNSMSIVGAWGGAEEGGLHIVRVDENQNRTFLDVLHLYYLERWFEPKELIKDYFTLYKGVKATLERISGVCKVVCNGYECSLEGF